MKRESAEVEASKLDESSRRVWAVLADHPIRSYANLPMDRVIDLCDREKILDELTSPLVSAQMKLLSWSGAQDAVLEDLR